MVLILNGNNFINEDNSIQLEFRSLITLISPHQNFLSFNFLGSNQTNQ
jgi:hypothetical protein